MKYSEVLKKIERWRDMHSKVKITFYPFFQKVIIDEERYEDILTITRQLLKVSRNTYNLKKRREIYDTIWNKIEIFELLK